MSSQDRAYLVRQYGKPGSNDATYEPVEEWHDVAFRAESVDLNELDEFE